MLFRSDADIQLSIQEPEDPVLKTIIDMTAKFISADGEAFEKVSEKEEEEEDVVN